MSYQITQTMIRFPDLRFQTRDAHKLRGFFGNLFKEYSPLLHNHFEDGSLRYAYPLVQYKVVDNIPMLTGFGEGGRLLIDLFLKIKISGNAKMEGYVLTDISGQIILQNSVKGNIAVLNTGSFPQGLYFLKIFTEEDIFSKKVLIKH